MAFATSADAVTFRHDRSLVDARNLAAQPAYESVTQMEISFFFGAPSLASGVLIHPEWVLTAAHPITAVSITGIELDFTDQDTGTPVTATAADLIPFPDFNPFASAFNLDIGLVRLTEPLTDITPSPIFRDDGGERDQDITIVGYGSVGNGFSGAVLTGNGLPAAVTNTVDAFGGEPASPFSLSAYLPSVMFMDFDPAPGASAVNPLGSASPTDLEGLSALGDSGGPGFIDVDGVPTVAGVVSVGLSRDSVFSAYGDLSGLTRVAAFTEWIDQHVPLGLTGDFNQDGQLTDADIDLLVSGFGGADLGFDLDGSGVVDAADLDAWLLLAGSTRGDANVDGLVDLVDLSQLASGFGHAGAWGDGDFNADSQVDLIDLSLLAGNFGFAAVVPEPAGMWGLLGGVVGVFGRRRADWG
ncbi:trypsin-like serine protease [Mucisphaera sp.]|uniref:trypsin-like serine protease n=1 Tax=Mucisphaera sp. TaxID=2913024 RepID=UPI003D09C98A